MPFLAMPIGKGDTTNYQLLHATDHAETVKVTYDPNKISLDKLLQYYFRVIDPTSINKQGNDRGRQYRTGILLSKMSKIKWLLRQH